MFRKNKFIKCSYLKNSEILSLYIINIFQKQNSGYMVIKTTEERFHPPGNPCLRSLLSTFITFPPHLLFHIVLLAGMCVCGGRVEETSINSRLPHAMGVWVGNESKPCLLFLTATHLNSLIFGQHFDEDSW